MGHEEAAFELRVLAAQLRGQLGRWSEAGTMRVPAAEAEKKEPTTSTTTTTTTLGGGVERLRVVREELGECTRCKLHGTRTNIVFGVGNPDASLVFVGEAPGFHEDQKAEPFVGDAGQLLTKMIEAMGWMRDEVYICNVLRCRPPANRNPEADEIEACAPFLEKTILAIKPRVIVALGKFPGQFLTGKLNSPISALRGQFHSYKGIKVMPTYHPAYLLRTPSAKRMVWDDLKMVIAEMSRLGIDPPHAKR